MKIREIKPVLSAQAIADRVRQIAKDIDRQYGDEPLVVVCVLKGAFMFFTDLVRHMVKPHVELDFVRLASYGLANSSSRTVSFGKDVDISLEGKHVLVVEDIIDTGHSMDFLLGQFAARGARSLRLAVLVDKHERREVPVNADFVGFPLKEGFIVGFGLDYAEQYRNLPGVYEIIGE